MRDVNKVILVGRLGADPIQRTTKSGKNVIHFSLATSRRLYREDAESHEASTPSEETQWHRIVVWGKSGEACAQFLKKGSAVYVEGAIRSHSYKDKEGAARMSFEIQAEVVNFLDSGAKLANQLGQKEVPEEISEPLQGEALSVF
jgi:single-strand DNA-binding protein